MNSKVYEIGAIVGFIICLVLCLILIPNIGAFKFIGIILLSLCAGLCTMELTYLATFKFLESTDPNDWEFAVLEKMFEDGTKKYYPVIKTVKFGYFVSIDKTFISSVSQDVAYDTYEDALEILKEYKQMEVDQYNEELQKIKSGMNKKLKVLNKKYYKLH